MLFKVEQRINKTFTSEPGFIPYPALTVTQLSNIYNLSIHLSITTINLKCHNKTWNCIIVSREKSRKNVKKKLK